MALHKVSDRSSRPSLSRYKIRRLPAKFQRLFYSNFVKALLFLSFLIIVVIVVPNGFILIVKNNFYQELETITHKNVLINVSEDLPTEEHVPIITTKPIEPISVLKSHVLENFCKFPILAVDEVTVGNHVTHPRSTNCTRVQEDYVKFDPFTSTLTVDQKLAEEILKTKISCQYRMIGGTEKPDISKIKPLREWSKLPQDGSAVITEDQFEVECSKENQVNSVVFQFAFAQIGQRPGVKWGTNTETRLSVDIIALESVSFNAFRRHMHRTYEYMNKDMQFYHLEGYNKVAHNSMVNLIPILSGLRYIDYASQNESMKSDLPENVLLDFDTVPFIWKDFFDKNCATMFNDDIGDYERGLFHHPWHLAKGFSSTPTDHYFRPWHVWHRHPPSWISNITASEFCFGNEPSYQLQLRLVEQFVKVYNDTCHFSFSHFSELTAENPSNLERLDEDLIKMLKHLHVANHLNHTALIIMGDKGHSEAPLASTYVGRIEERMPFFGIYFPPWFRRRHPDLMLNLEYNKNRLTSNYDVYRLLRDIVDERFDAVPRPAAKGISLFSQIPSNRSCADANILTNHCTCMETVKDLKNSDKLYNSSYEALKKFTVEILERNPDCTQKFQDIEIQRVTLYTTSQMIQLGIGQPTEEFLKKLQQPKDGEIEYVEISYVLLPWNTIQAKIRLQHDKKSDKVLPNSDVLLINFNQECMKNNADDIFCTCLSNFYSV